MYPPCAPPGIPCPPSDDSCVVYIRSVKNNKDNLPLLCPRSKATSAMKSLPHLFPMHRVVPIPSPGRWYRSHCHPQFVCTLSMIYPVRLTDPLSTLIVWFDSVRVHGQCQCSREVQLSESETKLQEIFFILIFFIEFHIHSEHRVSPIYFIALTDLFTLDGNNKFFVRKWFPVTFCCTDRWLFSFAKFYVSCHFDEKAGKNIYWIKLV